MSGAEYHNEQEEGGYGDALRWVSSSSLKYEEKESLRGFVEAFPSLRFRQGVVRQA